MIISMGSAPQLQHACSRAGCDDEATWAIHWRNPKIHDATRRKTWLACAAHRAYLVDFLEARSFLLEVIPVSELIAQ